MLFIVDTSVVLPLKLSHTQYTLQDYKQDLVPPENNPIHDRTHARTHTHTHIK